MKGLFSLISVFISLAVTGQVNLAVDRTEIRIGDQIKATITADLSGGKEWIAPEKIWPDSMQGIEIVSGPVLNQDDPRVTTASWMVALFDTGWVRLPKLPVVIRQQGSTDTVYTNDIPIKVLAVEPDSTGLADIKDIYYQPFNPGYYKKYIPHVLVALLLITGLVFWLRQRKSKRAIPEPVVIPLRPEQWAEQALQQLAEQKLWQRGDVKEHYSALTDILREYLERRFGIHAKEQTSDEILHQLRKLSLSQALLTDTEQLLSVADLIKFAKADPGMDIHAYTIGRVRQFVAETTPSEPEPINSSDDGVVA